MLDFEAEGGGVRMESSDEISSTFEEVHPWHGISGVEEG